MATDLAVLVDPNEPLPEVQESDIVPLYQRTQKRWEGVIQTRYKTLSTQQDKSEELKILRKQLKVLNEVMNTRKELLTETNRRESELEQEIHRRAVVRNEHRNKDNEERQRIFEEENTEYLKNYERLEILKKQIGSI